MYYVMGLHSVHSYYKNLTHLGFFNPRSNIAYRCPVTAITKETIEEIESNVICYNTTANNNASSLSTTSVPKRTSANTEMYYSVADICSVTGLNKNIVYADIRAGNLNASKKGNKYVVSAHEYNRYIEYIDSRRKMAVITTVVVGIISLLFIILIMFGLLL
jgi:hypothetical protein